MIAVNVITPGGRNRARTEDLLTRFPALASYRLQTAFETDVIPQMKAALFYPGPAKNGLNSGTPFLWSFDPAANARARRWFFANYPEGYTRSGNFGRAWEITVAVKQAEVMLSVSNPTPGTRYIVGDFANGAGQIPGHRRTGWPLAAPAIKTGKVRARAVARLTINKLFREALSG